MEVHKILENSSIMFQTDYSDKRHFCSIGTFVSISTKYYFVTCFHCVYDNFRSFPELLSLRIPVTTGYEVIKIDFDEIELISDFKSDLIFLKIPENVKEKIVKSECYIFDVNNVITASDSIPQNSSIVAYDFMNSVDRGVITLNEVTNNDSIVGRNEINNFYEWAFKSDNFEFKEGYSGTPIFKLTDSRIFIYGLFKQIHKKNKKNSYYRSVHYCSINRLFKAIAQGKVID